MKERILTNWSFTRALYLILGSIVIVQSVISREWIGIAFGGYFAAMGLFALGCAAGNCYGGSCETKKSSSLSEQEVEFEEIHSK
nr:hypothetical protein [uncultured Brumimicrobium sp.]